MKIKTAELIGLPLDWAVAVCEGKEKYFEVREGNIWYERGPGDFIRYSPPTDWSQGGPIMERKRIVPVTTESGELWDAKIAGAGNKYYRGPTALIAIMRCYVASQLGDEIEVPDYLLTA